MKKFEIYASEVPLKPILRGSKGYLYTQQEAAFSDKLMIRHFNGTLPAKHIPTFVNLTDFVCKWLEDQELLCQKIELQPFIEWGEDYTVRKYQIYQTSLSYIKRNRDTFGEPKSLMQLRTIMQDLLQTSNIPEVVKTVLSKSFLDDAKKTLYDELSDTYLIIELSVNVEDLEEWSKIID